MQCSKCGARFPDGNRFCPNCGTPVQAPQPNVQQAPQPAPKKKNTGLVIALTAVSVLLVAAIAAIVILLPKLKDNKNGGGETEKEKTSASAEKTEAAGTTAAEPTSASPEQTDPATTAEPETVPEPAQTNTTESCDYFTISLPASWAGRYDCFHDGDRLTFNHKQATAQANGNYSPMLFSVSVYEMPASPEEMGPYGDGSYEVCMLQTANGDRYTVSVYENAPEMFPPAYREELTEMNGFLEDITDCLTPENGATLIPFAYDGMCNPYHNLDYYGSSYAVEFYYCTNNILTGEISVSNGGVSPLNARMTARMYGPANDAYGVFDFEADEGGYGTGFLRFDGRTLRLWVKYADYTWAQTADYIDMT